MKPFSWLASWLGKEKKIEISLPSFAFEWPDASREVCKICGVSRKNHMGSEHKFYEVVKRGWL